MIAVAIVAATIDFAISTMSAAIVSAVISFATAVTTIDDVKVAADILGVGKNLA